MVAWQVEGGTGRRTSTTGRQWHAGGKIKVSGQRGNHVGSGGVTAKEPKRNWKKSGKKNAAVETRRQPATRKGLSNPAAAW